MSPMRQMVQNNRFGMVARPDVPRSAFDIPFSHKTTLEGAALTPIYVDEVLPGDSLRLRMTLFARLATPLVPVMDNLQAESFFFFVPNRLLWDKWARFMGEQENITDTTQFTIPQVTIDSTMCGQGTLANYFGLIKPAAGQTYTVSSLPLRAYNKIFNEWFRDQDLQNPVAEPTGDGPDNMSDFGASMLPLPRLKRPDYFTSARPWPQKPASGSAFAPQFNANEYIPGYGFANSLQMGAHGAGAPVTGLGVVSAAPSVGPQTVKETGSRDVSYATFFSDAGHDIRLRVGAGDYPDVRVLVQDIRTSVMIQHMLERNARGGTRYAELIESHFGVRSPDQRLQRPEYLGGGRSYVHFSPVAQTAPDSGGQLLGELGAFGTVAATEHGFSASFVEHGIVVGLVNIRADVSYQAGVNRMWFRRTIFDHYWPSLAHLGEQAILSRELWVDGTAADDAVFGYQERWSEYKYKPNLITGMFQSWAATPLDVWHLAEHFATRPSLNSLFVQQSSAPVDRVLQTPALFGEQFLCDFAFDLRWVRPMPMFSIPGVVGRF